MRLLRHARGAEAGERKERARAEVVDRAQRPCSRAPSYASKLRLVGKLGKAGRLAGVFDPDQARGRPGSGTVVSGPARRCNSVVMPACGRVWRKLAAIAACG